MKNEMKKQKAGELRLSDDSGGLICGSNSKTKDKEWLQMNRCPSTLVHIHRAEGRKLFAPSEEVTPFPGIAVQDLISSRPNSCQGNLQ